MTTNTGFSRVVEDFCDSLEEGPSVLIGTGRLGKSTTLAEHDEIRLVKSLPELHELEMSGVRDHEYPVIDSFYRIHVEYTQSSSTDYRKVFENILRSGSLDDGTSVGAVLRPWSYQYICSNSGSQLGSAITDWDRYYATVSKKDANKIGSELTDLDSDTIDSYLHHTYYEYKIDTETVTYSYETYVPHLLLDLTHDADGYLGPGVVSKPRDDTSGRLTGTLSDLGRDLFKAASISNIQSSADKAFNRLRELDPDSVREMVSGLDRDSIPDDVIEYLSQIDADDISDPLLKSVGNAIPGAYPVLLLILYFTSQEDERIASFEQFQQQSQVLFGEAVPTPTQELIEANLDLEPYTLESVRRVASEETIAKLRTIQAGLQNTRDLQQDLSNEISDIEAAFESLERQVKEFDTDLTDLRDRFDKIESQLSNNVVSHPEVVDTKFKHSILDIDRLEQQLAYQEDRYLNISDEEQIKITDLPREKKTQWETQRALEDNHIVILRGAIGTGKTTTAYHTLKAIKRTGAFVGLVNFERSEYSYIRRALERVDNQARYLFASYRLGFPAVDTPRQLRNLLELVNDGLCDKIIIECRDEVYQDLLNRGGDVTQGHQGLPSIWRSRGTIECRGVNDDTAEEIASWTYAQHNINDAEIGEEVLTTNRLVEKFGQNPEFIKIAARLSAEGASVDDVETIGGLIELDIRSLLGKFGEHGDRYREFIELLALTRGISVEQAMAIIGDSVRHADIIELEEALRGYVKFPQNNTRSDTSTLVPDIYTDLLFQFWYIDDNPPAFLLAQARDILEQGYDELIPNVLLNLSLSWSRYPKDSVQREKILEAATDSLSLLSEQGSSDNYLKAISNLGSIPVNVNDIEWSQIRPNLTKEFMENMWNYRVYSEAVIGSVLDEGYNESLDLTVSLGRLLASHLQTHGADEAKQTYAKAGELLFSAGESCEWSDEVMAHLPADLLTYALMESAQITSQKFKDSETTNSVEPIFEFFDELNQNQTIHAEAAGRLFAVPFTNGHSAPSQDFFDWLKQMLDQVSPYLHKIAERANLFEPKERVDWSSPPSVFLRRFHLEISLLTGLESHHEKFEEWMTLVWESTENTIEYCEDPPNSLFATVRTVLLGAAIRQEMELNRDSDLLSICSRTMIREVSPQRLPSSEPLLRQWFTDHPDSWYARLLEWLFMNIIGQEKNESFGDELMYKIAGEEEPDRRNLIRIVCEITNQIQLLDSAVRDTPNFYREVCYAWYRGLVLSGEPAQLDPYLQHVEKKADQVLSYNEKKYLCLWTVADDEIQAAAGGAADPYSKLSFDHLISRTTKGLLSWLEAFLTEPDVLLAASRFSIEQYDTPAQEIEKLLTEIIGILASTSGVPNRPIDENEFEEIFSQSQPTVQNIKKFVEESHLHHNFSREMRATLKLVETY